MDSGRIIGFCLLLASQDHSKCLSMIHENGQQIDLLHSAWHRHGEICDQNMPTLNLETMRNGTAGKILEMEDIQYINLRNITKLQGNGRKQGIGHDKTILQSAWTGIQSAKAVINEKTSHIIKHQLYKHHNRLKLGRQTQKTALAGTVTLGSQHALIFVYPVFDQSLGITMMEKNSYMYMCTCIYV